MLDALEWAVNKTPFSDTRLRTRRLVQPALAQDQDARGQLPRELDVTHDNRGITSHAPFVQPAVKSLQLGR